MLKKYYQCISADINKSVVLLALRLLLAYCFWGPAMGKIKDIGAVAEWFKSLNFILPTLNAYLATFTELSGIFLLTLGLFTRLITIPLIIVMLVAIIIIHGGNGFDASKNGFEIPLYYLFMLVVLMVFGAGKFSLDYFISKKCCK